MNNKVEVRGNTAIIQIKSKGEITCALVDTNQLPKVAAIPGSWYAMNVGGKRGEKIYVGTTIGGITIYLHMLIKGKIPGLVIDHINHDTLDNRRENIRNVTTSENGQNRKGAQVNNLTSGIRNVYQNGKNWAVRLTKNGKTIHVGTYPSIYTAERIASKARQYYYEEGGHYGNRKEFIV